MNDLPNSITESALSGGGTFTIGQGEVKLIPGLTPHFVKVGQQTFRDHPLFETLV